MEVSGVRYKPLTEMNGIGTGESIIIDSIDKKMKDRFVVFVNEQIGYNAIVQIRYGSAEVVFQTQNDCYSFSVAETSDYLTIKVLYNGDRGKVLSYMPI